MARSKNTQQIAPEDVRVKVRLYNRERRLRDVEVPSTLVPLADIVAAVALSGDRFNQETVKREEIDALIENAKATVAKVRTKNVAAQLAMKEWMHSLYAIRKYKVNTNNRAGRNVESVRIAFEAWPIEQS